MTTPIGQTPCCVTTPTTMPDDTIPVTMPGTMSTDTCSQAQAASMNAVLSGAAATASALMTGDNTGDVLAELQALAKDPTAAVDSDAGGGGGGGQHEHECDGTTEVNSSGISLQQKTPPPPNLSGSNNLQAAAEAQLCKNQSIYSSATPEQISTTIASLQASLQENPVGLSSATIAIASSHLSIAAQLTTQLSNPSQAGNSSKIRQDIQTQVASAYTAIFSELLANPSQMTAVLSMDHNPSGAIAITNTLVQVQSGDLPLPGGNVADVVNSVNAQSTGTPPPTMEVVSNQQLCNLLGAFAAATQNNQVLGAVYSSTGATDSSNIASDTVTSSEGQLGYVKQQVQKSEQEQEQAEAKQKSESVWQKIGVACECIAIVITIAVVVAAGTVGAAFSGGLTAIAALVVAAALVSVMAMSIASTYDSNCPNPMTLATNSMASDLVADGMSPESAQILATVIMAVVMIVAGGFASQGASAGEVASMADDAAEATGAASELDCVSTIMTTISDAIKSAATSVGDTMASIAKTGSEILEMSLPDVLEALAQAAKDAALAIPRSVSQFGEDAGTITTYLKNAVQSFRTGEESANAIGSGAEAVKAGAGVLAKLAATLQLITSTYEGVTQIQIGELMEEMSVQMANIGTSQGTIELMNMIIQMQNKQGSSDMQSYQAIAQQLSNTDIQQAAGAGSTQAEMLSQNMS